MTVQSENCSGLTNRIDPWGRFHAAKEQGAWMGNRGILHDDEKKIIRPWQHNSWVTCRLQYKDYRREGNSAREKLFTPNNYSELFFLDEATAFAAGHRPCGQCRNRRYKEFKAAWIAANRDHFTLGDNPDSDDMDKELQRERAEGVEKKTYEAPLESLPIGTMVDIKGSAYLLWRGRLYKWSFAGYEEDKTKRPSDMKVQVLTPVSIVRMFVKGFIPEVHVSAFW